MSHPVSTYFLLQTKISTKSAKGTLSTDPPRHRRGSLTGKRKWYIHQCRDLLGQCKNLRCNIINQSTSSKDECSTGSNNHLRSTNLFIGPESDHWLCLSLTDWLTNWLTNSCLVNLIDVTLRCDDVNSKLFIGPESDHWLCLSLTNSLTDWLTEWLLFSGLNGCEW